MYRLVEEKVVELLKEFSKVKGVRYPKKIERFLCSSATFSVIVDAYESGKNGRAIDDLFFWIEEVEE